VFNVVFRNQDDHTKNFGFVMNSAGAWRLAPAFDLTYVYGVGASATHQMTLAGKDDDFTREDFLLAGKAAGLRKAPIEAILDLARSQAEKFSPLAAEHGLEEPKAAGVASRFRII
jgi:serine/threonine-protein kinase HipA